VLRGLLPAKYSPLQPNGDGLQSVYLTEVPTPLANALIQEIGTAYYDALSQLESSLKVSEDDESVDAMRGRTDIGATQIDQLIKARRGQGIFRSNVRLNEKCCRVTGTADPKHLRASHIKPWRICTDDEKLDGCNGLLLAPHVDHLFDRGYIGFPMMEPCCCPQKCQ
jgi:HNH endonuclease